MVLASELVRPERITGPGRHRPVDPLSAAHGYVDIAVRFDELTADGVYGDPSRASIDLGKRILSAALSRSIEFCRRFVGDPATTESPSFQ